MIIGYIHKIKRFIFKENLKRDYYRNDYYTRISSKYDKLESYLSLHQKCLDANYFNTKTEINFIKTIRFDEDLKTVKAAISVPDFRSVYNKDLDIEILFYKIIIGTHKVKCQIHFFKNKMLLCNYTFAYLKIEQQKEVIQILQKKYLPDITHYKSENILDKHHNCIHIEKDLEFTINYLSLQSNSFNDMKMLKQERDIHRQNMLNAKEMEIYDNL